MGWATGAMKCILNTLNLLLAIGGLGLISFATLTLNSSPPVYVYYLYLAGIVSVVAALMGCCGICKENVCMTTTYAVFIFLSLLMQIFGKFYASDSETIRKYAASTVDKTWQREIKNPGAMDTTQQTYECCGKTGPDNYFEIGRSSYPSTCYPNLMVNMTALYHNGCSKAAEDKFIAIFNYSSNNEWITLIITLVMFLFAVYLVRRFSKKQRVYNY